MAGMRSQANRVGGPARQGRRRADEPPDDAQDHQQQHGHADRTVQTDDRGNLGTGDQIGDLRQQPGDDDQGSDRPMQKGWRP